MFDLSEWRDKLVTRWCVECEKLCSHSQILDDPNYDYKCEECGNEIRSIASRQRTAAKVDSKSEAARKRRERMRRYGRRR